MTAEIILTKVNTTTCESVNETFRDDTFIIDESIDNDQEKDISQDTITDLVDNIVASSKEDDDTMPPVDQDESKESKNTEMNTSCARNCKESLPIPTTSCIEEVPLTSSTPPPLPTEPITAAVVVVSDDEPSPIQQNETNETIDIGDIMSPLDCIKDDEKGLASDKQTDEENANSTANEESAASTNDNDVTLQSKEQDNSSPQNQATIQPLSKLNLEPTKTATESSTASSVILSDSGESKCTLTSTLPVINLTMSGKEDRDEKLVALGVFVKPANGDGDEGSNAKVDEDVGKESSMTQSTADDGDAPVDETIDNKDTGRSESRLINTNEQVETTSATIPSALSPTSLTSTSSSSILLDKKRLSERLKQRLAKRNSDSTTGDGPLIPTTKPPPKRDTARDREQWETRLRAASRHKRASKTRTKSIDDTNSDILSRYSGSDEIDVGDSHKIYPDTVTFSDGEDDINDVNDVSSKTVVNRRTAYRKCVSEVGVSSLRPTQSPTKLSKHHHSHHHGIGILQSDGIVYDDALLLRLARQARFGQGRGEASTNASSAASSEAKGGVDSRANEVKIHVYDLLAKDSLVEVPYLGCNFPIGQCFKTLNDGCHVLGTGAYHVGVEVSLCWCISYGKLIYSLLTTRYLSISIHRLTELNTLLGQTTL